LYTWYQTPVIYVIKVEADFLVYYLFIEQAVQLVCSGKKGEDNYKDKFGYVITKLGYRMYAVQLKKSQN